MAPKKKRKTIRIAEWEKWLELFETKDETLQKFCNINDLSYEAARKAFATVRENRAKAEKENSGRKKTGNPAIKTSSIAHPKSGGKAPAGGVGAPEIFPEIPAEKSPEIGPESGEGGNGDVGEGESQGKRQRIDWLSLRDQFHRSDHTAVRDFLREIGLSVSSRTVDIRTVGWASHKKKLNDEAHDRAVTEYGRERFEDAKLTIVNSLYDCETALKEAAARAKILTATVKTVRDLKDLTAGVQTVIGSLDRCWSSLAEKELDYEKAKIIRDLQGGKMSLPYAALACSAIGVKLPAAIQLLLSKEVDLNESEDLEDLGVSDEELDALYGDGIKTIEDQEEKFLPERRKQVAEMRDEVGNRDGGEYQVKEGE